MDVQVLVALHADEIVPVSLVIAEKQVLAVRAIQIFPVSQSLFYGKQWRMCMKFIRDAVPFKEIEHFLSQFQTLSVRCF